MYKKTRINNDDALELFSGVPLLELAERANAARAAMHPDNIVTFVIDRNINYTNICVCKCKFCAYFRDKNAPDAFLMDYAVLGEKIRETIEAGGSQILIQGGLHPDLDINWYVDMVRYIKKNYKIWIHGFSPPEITHIARQSGLSLNQTVGRLIEAGLDSIPGGGAEVLSNEVRREISPRKIDADEWIAVMETAHALGMKTTATMMFRRDENPVHLLEHLLRIRDLQDKTGGFTAFIPWPFQPENTKLGGTAATAAEYLRVLAASRIILDNILNIQVSWVTQGEKIGQIGLFFGANDFGSVMMEENVVKAAGATFRMQTADIRRQIRAAGFEPKIRNMAYEIIGN
ncbi:MAG: dehypoxanthine futalosine cyclase [Deferribacteraceae bacterium]|jgi:cyclic dehypoxanthinyl futalosine synthase|nr:dehypoxanthine futalosine cyclase [Deferribacteraceae bacterium]